MGIGHPQDLDDDALFDVLCAASLPELQRWLEAGHPVDLDQVVDHDYQGLNVGIPALTARFFRRFQKVFRAGTRPGVLDGINLKIVQSAPSDQWIVEQGGAPPEEHDALGRLVRWLVGFQGDSPVHGPFGALPASDDDSLSPRPGAMLIDYRLGEHGIIDVTRFLRDYVVSVRAGSANVLLGVAYIHLGPVVLPTPGYFIMRRVAPDLPTSPDARRDARA